MKNQLKIGVILSYVISIVQILIQLVYTPIMLRLLGQNEYGLYTLVASVVSYLSLCGLGFSSSYLRFYSRYQAKNDQEGVARLNGMFLTIYSLIAVVSLILGSFLVVNCGAVLGDQITSAELGTARILMAILVVNIAITFVNTIFDSIITSQEAFLFQRVVRLLSVVANPLLALPLLMFGYKSVSLVMVTTLLSFGTLVVNIYYCTKKVHARFKFGRFEKGLLAEIGAFSFFVFLNMIIDQVNWNVDKFLLGRFCGTAAVAVYGIGSQLNNIDINISLSVSSVFSPRVNRYGAAGNSENEYTQMFIKTGRIQCLIMALLDSGLLFFGLPFITLWAGEGYEEAYYVMLLLVLPAFVSCIQNIGLEMQRAKNMHHYRSIAYLVMAVINVMISIPLTQIYGPVGSAFGTTISLIVGNGCFMNWFYYKKMKIDIPAFWKSILSMVPAMLVPFGVGTAFMLFIDMTSWVKLIAFGVVYVAIYCLFVWLFAMNDYEKDLIRGMLVRKKNK